MLGILSAERSALPRTCTIFVGDKGGKILLAGHTQQSSAPVLAHVNVSHQRQVQAKHPPPGWQPQRKVALLLQGRDGRPAAAGALDGGCDGAAAAGSVARPSHERGTR
jgi:hypothetical protein